MRNFYDNPVCKWKKYIKLVKTLNLHFQFERQTFNNKFLNEKLILNVCQLYKLLYPKAPDFCNPHQPRDLHKTQIEFKD